MKKNATPSKHGWKFAAVVFVLLLELTLPLNSRAGVNLPLKLSVFPARPTSADVVEIRVGGGGQTRRALSAGSNAFFVEGADLSQRATYTLGALTPGDYSFSLFQQQPGTPFCTHELKGKLDFTVSAVDAPSGSELILLLLAANEAQAQTLIARERPRAEWLFGNTVALSVIPGLERSYARLLRQNPLVKFVESNDVGFIPECPPPLGPAVALGSLLVSFKDGVARREAEASLNGLPPQLEGWESLLKFDQGAQSVKRSAAWVRVPADWEALFLGRYLRHQSVVLCGITLHGLPRCNPQSVAVQR